jgi:uncharacterized membrane protein YidH (DUF202 family)
MTGRPGVGWEDGEVGDEGDRGLQAERTELAWIRTALACGALTTLTGRLAGGSVAAPVAYGLGAAIAATGVAAALLRIGTLRRAGGPGAPPPRLAVALLAGCVVAGDLVALALIVV